MNRLNKQNVTRQKRREFYVRNGFHSTGNGFPMRGVNDEILVKGKEFTREQCERLFRKLSFGLVKIK
ncbi:MAG: hypothetical protein HFE39_00765 [Clostridiales bacterium]|jgi:hypothetical protein|nr:hypothetical protein [Clostridiales bacterium]